MLLRCRVKPAEPADANSSWLLLSLEPPSARGCRSKAHSCPFAELSGAHQEHALSQRVGMLQVGEFWVTEPSWSVIQVVGDTVSGSLALKIETCGRTVWF